MKVLTTKQMRKIEKAADAGGLSYATMMENAGQAVAQAVQRYSGDLEGKKILILIGPGNNGGDGLVAGRHLNQKGAHAVLYIWKRKSEGDENFRLAQERKIPVIWAEEDTRLSKLRGLLAKTDIIVDALLGTGVSRPIKGLLKTILDAVKKEAENRQQVRISPGTLYSLSGPRAASAGPGLPIIAVDVPSGLNCDTGEVEPATVPAALTVTFGYPKIGQFLFPGAEYVGQLLVADIGLPAELAAEVEIELTTPELVRELLPERPLAAHKGTFGKALIAAGSVNYSGAAYLAGVAATRVGAGLVTLALAQSIYPIVAARSSETTFLLLPHDMGVLIAGAAKVLKEKMSDYQALLLGPGLGREKKTIEFVRVVLTLEPTTRKARLGFVSTVGEEENGEQPLPPLVIDADGLNALADIPHWWTRLQEKSILTPHPGEMARLTGLSVAEVEADRLAVARRMAAQWKQVVVLKGAYTVIAAPQGRVALNPFANPGLATAGSGDVLAGAIVGFLAQGLAPWEAAVVGAYIHGLAAELGRDRLGAAGLVAGDLLPLLPRAIELLK